MVYYILHMEKTWTGVDAELTQHTTPIAKFHIWVDAHLVLSGKPFYSKKYRFFNTTKPPPEHCQNSTETPRKHEQDLKHHRTPSRLTDTLPKCHQGANDHQNTIERPPRHQQEDRHHQPSGLTPSGQTQPIPERAREGLLFSQKVAASILRHNIIFPITIITTPSVQTSAIIKTPSSSSSSSSSS